eukprot:TRINITY_DN8935_c0_g1_i1.p1 TRINITY_DN8935_c0_g1~~TRINITY_DN8935_c0_g1_i1.p1  ORF type:complete len:291 (-),score=131.20 TRINITY_DN8935_c0_g1_i1:21-893(-)
MEFSEEQINVIKNQYQQNGYYVVSDFWNNQQIQTILTEINRIVDEFQPDPTFLSIFSTISQEETSDSYFLTSGDKIRFFLEEGIVNEQGKLTVDKKEAINKIGHGLHELNDIFREYSTQPKIKQIAKLVMNLIEPQIVQSMVICKPPKIGGYVDLHQDSTFLYTEPLSCNAFWWALEDATVENGCLFVKPGSHTSIVKRKFIRNPDPNSKNNLIFDPPKPETQAEDLCGFIPLECKAGSLVILHGSTEHYSNVNTSPNSRNVYTMHVIDGKANYLSNNWLQIGRPFFSLN